MTLPVVHVLLATYNGERHIGEQWASLQAQQNVEIVLHVADDGSTDRTVQVIHELAASSTGAVRAVHWIHRPPRRCATRSFLLLIEAAVSRFPEAAWFAFCDQDDIWLPGKLAAAVEAMSTIAPAAVPALYGGRTLNVDQENSPINLSPLFKKNPSFRNAIVQSIMGGNTMVLNRPAALLVAASAESEVAAHDWFIYQLISGVDGVVHYDPRPFLRYRQHGNNVVGSSLGWRARGRRFMRMLRGDFRSWNEKHLTALLACSQALTPENHATLVAFEHARRASSVFDRLGWLHRSGVYRQTSAQQIALWAACLLRRI